MWLRTSFFAVLISYSCFASSAIEYQNCQQNWSIAKKPQHIVALNQSAADILLALQAGEKLAGVSYLDDAPDALKQGHYHGVKIIAKEYPAVEILYSSGTDFVVASYISAFQGSVTDRQSLQKNGIGSYLLHDGCRRTHSTSFADIIADIQTLGHLLDREHIAQQLIDRIEQRRIQIKALPKLNQPPKVFYYDGGTHDIYTQGNIGFLNHLLSEAGAENLFAHIQQKWVHVSAEMLISQQPDLILLSDDLRMTAAQKINFMRTDPIFSQLHAVQKQRFITIKFSDLYPGANSGETLWILAQQIRLMTEK